MAAEYMQDEDLGEQIISEVDFRKFLANTASSRQLKAIGDEKCDET